MADEAGSQGGLAVRSLRLSEQNAQEPLWWHWKRDEVVVLRHRSLNR